MLYTCFKQFGNAIFYSFIGDDGQTYHQTVRDYKPKLYLETDEHHEDQFKTLFGQPVRPVEFDGIKEAKNFSEKYAGVQDFRIHGNFKFANQFNIEMYEGEQPPFEKYSIRGCILDIEVTAPEFPNPDHAAYPIDAVTLYDTVEGLFTVFGLGPYDRQLDDTPASKVKVVYKECATEVELLKEIVNYLSSGSFHYTSGWNSQSFDMPYIVNRVSRVLNDSTANKLSPYKKILRSSSMNSYGKVINKVEIVGLPHLDYMLLYKKHVFTPRESYSLNFIAQEELGTEKLSYQEEGSLANLSQNNFQKYISYNIIDVDIIRQLNNKLGLYDLTFTLAYYSLSNYEDTLGTVRLWEQLIAKELYKRGMVPPTEPLSTIARDYPGGYVSAPQVGRHHWVGSYDLNSLYPMLEVQINISPETFVPPEDLPDELTQLQQKLAVKDTETYYKQVMNLVNEEVDLSVLKKYDLSMSACGNFYRKDIKGIVPEIKEDIYNNRKAYKRKMLQAEADLDQIKTEMNKRGISA